MPLTGAADRNLTLKREAIISVKDLHGSDLEDAVTGKEWDCSLSFSMGPVELLNRQN